MRKVDEKGPLKKKLDPLFCLKYPQLHLAKTSSNPPVYNILLGNPNFAITFAEIKKNCVKT